MAENATRQGKRQFHIHLNRYDCEALDYMRAVYGTSMSAAIRACIRAAAAKAGFRSSTESGKLYQNGINGPYG